ncbi:MAG: alpha/beta fold hydrolase [Rhodocyclales bacterium]|nr:alpha/beta fold hydrolase [Rhodocyclales bacterium]
MVARQFQLLLLAELLFYALSGGLLVSRSGWSGSDAVALALATFLGLRLILVLLTFALSRRGSSELPAAARLGAMPLLRMVATEYLAFLLLFVVVIPFERFWLDPDRLGHCAARRTPLLLIHGYQCNRGFWFWLRRKLEAAGWTVATHDLEPVYADIDRYAPGIARRIDEVLAATGAEQVILVAHSMGGLACRAYLRRHGGGKVARLLTLGTPHRGTRIASLGLGLNARQMRIGGAWLAELAAGEVLPPGSASIYGQQDNYVFPQPAASTLAGAEGIAMQGVGHVGMAVSPRTLAILLDVLER